MHLLNLIFLVFGLTLMLSAVKKEEMTTTRAQDPQK